MKIPTITEAPAFRRRALHGSGAHGAERRGRRRRSLAFLALALLAALPSAQKLHPAFRLGARLSDLQPLLAKDCESLEQHHYTGGMAAPFRDQVQVDCHGLNVLGARRKVEFLFNDGPLGHLWVLIEADERPKIREKLERVFGPVVHDTEDYKVFAEGRVALRSDPAEILIGNEAMIERLTGYRKATRR
ncbi:MAG TPA: hypothetical protein VGR67_07600 [Candidatus Polarisedimenticolia bacterium]|nr:hypothetical protein [Candidatus Polarisedimenticolia bacterium]